MRNMSKHVTVAQVGVGYWGPNLLRNLAANKDCHVKMVADLSEERCCYAKNLYPGVNVTKDADTVFNDREIDAVVIATPVATHYALTLKALQSGKHVLVEKPMATTVKEVENIGTLAKEKALVAMAGHTFLYNPAVHYVKTLINDGKLGKIRYIYSQRLSLGRIRSDVDALWNFAPHDISIIQYWLGNPKPVSVCYHGMDYVQNGVQDVVFLNIVYPNKVIANIHVSWLDPQKVRRMTVVGSDKMVVYDDIAENKIAVYDKGIDKMAVLGENMDYDKLSSFAFNYRSGDVLLPKINWQEPLKIEIQHFVDCIKNKVECLTGPRHAMEVTRILGTKKIFNKKRK